MATQDCKKIEKHIKDLLFKGNPSTDSFNQNGKGFEACPMPFPIDEKCLVSNIEDNTQVVQKSATSPFVGLKSINDSISDQSGASELIDLNNLKDFAAKHIDDANFSAPNVALSSSEIVLPHPELEDDCRTNNGKNPNMTEWLQHISKEIQNSSNFISMPENPLPQMSTSPEKSVINNEYSENPEDPFAYKKYQQKKKKKGQKKNKDRMSRGVLPIGNNFPEISPEKESKNEIHRFREKLNASPPKKGTKTFEKEDNAASNKGMDIKPKFSPPVSGRLYYITLRRPGVVKYHCYLCKFNSNSKDGVMHHLRSRTHRNLKEEKDLEMLLPYLPEPLPGQTEAINKLLTSVVSQVGIQEEELLIREALGIKIKQFVQKHVPTCDTDLIGSSMTGLGFKTNKVDFILKFSSDGNIPDALENLLKALSSDDSFIDVISDFKKKRPGILFTDKETELPCNIAIDHGSSVKLTNLLSTYCKLDSRVYTLGTALRYWARLCEIDEQEKGTLPAFSFGILLVHFLQQVQPPVLPVLHEVKDYASTQEFYTAYLLEDKWHSENKDSIGKLWLKFFYYYNFTYKFGQDVVCIRTSQRVSCSDRNWTTKFYAIEDPFQRRNLAYVIPTHQVFRYIQYCFRRTYQYFAYPQLKKGSVKVQKLQSFQSFILSYISNKPVSKEESFEDSEASENEEDLMLNNQLDFNAELEDHDPDISFEALISTVTNMSLEEPTNQTENDSSSHENGEQLLREKLPKSDVIPSPPILCQWDIGGREFSIESYNYVFDASVFRGDMDVPLICRACKASGHQKKNCPYDILPPAIELPEMTEDFLKVVTRSLYYIRDKNVVNKSDMESMISDMLDIQSYIREVYPEATLSLFGSFCNGFGFRNRSDMDFCLTFKDRTDGKDLDSVEIIEKVAEQLRHYPRLQNIIPVTSAKVPIVKFVCTKSGLEGDISLYNTLAIANTEMLEAYSRIDERVQILGYGLKYFAKILGICDASRGSLSSYAYILMVIFFLQQRKPPVIPVLQELHGAEKPSEMIDGWNVWFFKDIEKLADVWPDYGKNKEGVAELWLALLSFYACDFNWKEYVISIRQTSLLTRFRKLWITDQIAIEDPFDLSHNLGAGLSRKMNAYIMKAFLRGRERFGIPLSVVQLNTIHNREVGYLFDRRFLTAGYDPPHDRGCRNCGKIGHFAKNCSQDKTCSICQKPGHLAKNCPKKIKWKKSKMNDSVDNQDAVPVLEKKGNIEKQNKIGHQRNQNRDMSTKTVPVQNIVVPLSNEDKEGRKLFQLGIPAHRFPPPGLGPRTFMPNPPPGFKSSMVAHQNMNYPPPFGAQHSHMTSPFPRTANMNEVVSQSPPKHYSSSPPKNFLLGKPFHHIPDSSRSVGVRPGLQAERHPVPQERLPHPSWPSRLHIQREPHPVHHQSNQIQNLDHRLKRTSADNFYNSTHADRW